MDFGYIAGAAAAVALVGLQAVHVGAAPSARSLELKPLGVEVLSVTLPASDPACSVVSGTGAAKGARPGLMAAPSSPGRAPLVRRSTHASPY
jgi:hypothetical protein